MLHNATTYACSLHNLWWTNSETNVRRTFVILILRLTDISEASPRAEVLCNERFCCNFHGILHPGNLMGCLAETSLTGEAFQLQIDFESQLVNGSGFISFHIALPDIMHISPLRLPTMWHSSVSPV